MKKYLVLILLIFAVALGCSKKDPIVAEWEGKSNDGISTTFEFKSDGKLTYKNEFGVEGTGTYEVKEDKVTMKLSNWEKEKVYTFKVDGDKLSLERISEYDPEYKEMTKK